MDSPLLLPKTVYPPCHLCGLLPVLEVGTVGDGRHRLPLQSKPMLGSNYLRLRIWRICWILVMNVGSNLVYICLGAYHPVDGKIQAILLVDFPQGDAIPSPALA